MGAYEVLIILICLSAAFAFINQKYLKLPFVIGLFFLSTLLSIIVILSQFFFDLHIEKIAEYLEKAQIDKLIIDIFLGFLLFAGALHTNWGNLKSQIRSIASFALVGVIISALIIAVFFYYISHFMGLEINFIYCLLFGALISPTDPIAVLGILKQAGVPKNVESVIVGESLFNDGVGVVLFIALMHTLNVGEFDAGYFGILFVQEAIGGVALGLIYGYALHILLKRINHYETEILLTLAFVMGGYYCANYFHISGALSMVVMGLMVGNFRTNVAMSDVTMEYVHKFWELVDVILNALLFLVIAFVLIVVELQWNYVILGLLSLIFILLLRSVLVYVPLKAFPKFFNLTRADARIISWGGLRGGLSLALALSLPDSPAKDIILVATYIIVLFSILVQGLTIGKVAKMK
ncbi:cation:proton antiporter [Frigoriflavimonas asaccharolytica]|uniref:CPA1 family monovalent cation:H+ antiporter n=1 Tax=Frigoriflavimonas asaccharolytica TaxID=2735899 RepID=A0A8J8KBF4_9FLAO|nr:sodium:proton antiporter [Frigoriflavimonas asaccharolytica]NRS92524.1 CPA1 family monovalent cation:H+ antiporter [Frigoriflavimonas asaccharolytica]